MRSKGSKWSSRNAIARAMLGDQAKVKLVRTVTDEKVSFVERGKVDLTVSAVSMNCERWEQVDFSSPVPDD